MSTIRISTGGESHGRMETCIIEGIPAGLALTASHIDHELARRQRGYGRGGRMAIESDRCRLVGGVRHGSCMGSPVVIVVENDDHGNWAERMQPEPLHEKPLDKGAGEPDTVPRAGHADLAGMAKYRFDDLRPVLERASARETVGRVLGGAVCKRLLEELGVSVHGRVVELGGVVSATDEADYAQPGSVDWAAVEASEMACDDPESTCLMCEVVDSARADGDSLGGVFEVWAWGLCPGLGSYVSMDRRLDGRLVGAMVSIPAIKGAEVGRAFRHAGRRGSEVHDRLELSKTKGWRGISRPTNRAGGLEGGVTNGMPLVLRVAMKPIPTLVKALPSVDVRTMESVTGHVERSDVTAVPAAVVVGEAMVALVLASAYTEKFAADSMEELAASVEAYEKGLEDRGLWRRS